MKAALCKTLDGPDAMAIETCLTRSPVRARGWCASERQP